MSEADLTTFNLQYDAWQTDRIIGDNPFEFFCADQFLKDRSLSDGEIRSGQVEVKMEELMVFIAFLVAL